MTYAYDRRIVIWTVAFFLVFALSVHSNICKNVPFFAEIDVGWERRRFRWTLRPQMNCTFYACDYEGMILNYWYSPPWTVQSTYTNRHIAGSEEVFMRQPQFPTAYVGYSLEFDTQLFISGPDPSLNWPRARPAMKSQGWNGSDGPSRTQISTGRVEPRNSGQLSLIYGSGNWLLWLITEGTHQARTRTMPVVTHGHWTRPVHGLKLTRAGSEIRVGKTSRAGPSLNWPDRALNQ